MSVSSLEIISSVSDWLLQDATNVRWTTSELLKWLNLGQDAIVLLKPDAKTVITQTQLVAGTMQTLPDGSPTYQDASAQTLRAGLLLLTLTRNLGEDGLTPGRSISIVDQELMNSINPLWHQDTAGEEVLHYMYNEKIPKVFFVTPPISSDRTWAVSYTHLTLPTN